MKKSMLLSTIAMIVVVVVALSTATFAWFSSFTAVTAESTLSISAGSEGIEVREIGADKQWTNALAPLTTKMAPVAPVEDIKAMTAPSGQGSNESTYIATTFFSATKKGSGIETNGVVQPTDNYIYAVFQVRNVQDKTSANIKITAKVVPNAEDAATDQDKFAVNNTKIVITYIKGLAAEPAPTATNIGTTFNYQMKNSEEKDDISASKTFLTTDKGKPSTLIPDDTAVKTVRVPDKSITVEDTFAAANNKASEWYTVGVYIWLDGHAADNYAAGASLKATITVAKA